MTPPRLPARYSAWAVIATLLPVTLASCRDIVAGDATNFPVALCTLLEDCEGGCADDLLARVQQASPELRDSLLAYDAEVDCLATCVGARSCRDQPPICHPTDDACLESYDCCGFTVGASQCEENSAESSKKCCLALGAVCVPDTQSCCGGQTCPGNGRCGGVECTLTVDEVEDRAEAACVESSECCSQRCEDGSCVANTCSPPGEACAVDLDCCSQTNPNGTSIQPICNDKGKCAAPNPNTCDVCVPSDEPELDCCTKDGETCYELVGGATECGDPTCTPLGAICIADEECCPSGDLPNFCSGNSITRRCDTQATCATENGSCLTTADCCDGSECVANAANGSTCRACLIAGAHSPCVVGLPLRSDHDLTVEAVCAEFPTCCCKAWLVACTNQYKNKGGVCPPGN